MDSLASPLPLIQALGVAIEIKHVNPKQLPKTMKKSIYEKVNENIIALLEKGVCPWRQPWNTQNRKPAINMLSKKAYRGINFILTNCQSYKCNQWATYKQIASKGGHVKKGEEGTPIIFWSTFENKTEPEKQIPFMKYSYIFNLEQCDGIAIEQPEQAPTFDHNPIEACENLISRFPLGLPEITHNNGKAFYNVTRDIIELPRMDLYASPQEYYSTYYHEIIHATGHKSRLDRKSVVDSDGYGNNLYCKEELIAELGACYLCAESGIDSATIENSASYLNNWINVLRGSPKLIIEASIAAKKASEFLIGKANDVDEKAEMIA